MSVEYNRKSAQPQQVRQVTIDPFTEGDTPEHLRRPRDDPFLSPFASPSHDQEDSRPSDSIDDLFRRISSLIQTTQGRIISLSTTKSLSEAEIKGKILDDFAQLSNAIWDALYRQRNRIEASSQPREWMRKLLKLEDEKRAVETQARVAIEEATAELQERLEACEGEISHLRETNAFLEQQNESFSGQLAVRLKPTKPEVPGKAVRPGVRRLERELNESIPKALAIARDLSLDSSVSSSLEPKHNRHNSTQKEAKIAPVPRKDPKNRSISPSDRQIHQLKTDLEHCKSQLFKVKQDRDRLQAWKDSYMRSPPQLASALQQIEQDNEHEHKKLVGKALILQHKLNAIQLGAQRFIRMSSSLLRFARDRDTVTQFEDARSELDVLLREIQRESKPSSTSMSATPTGGSPSRFSSAIHTPEKRQEPDKALKSLEKENRKLENQLIIERKRADTFAEALEVTQREVEALHGSSISPVLFIQQQEHTIRLLKTQAKAGVEGKNAENEANKRIMEMGDQLRRALDQVQVLRTSNNALMQDLVDTKGELSKAKDLFKVEITRLCEEMGISERAINAEFSKKDAALVRLKHTVFHRLQGYEATLVHLNSLFPSPSKESATDTGEKQHLEYLLQRSEDLSAAKEAELQAFIDQQGGVVAALRREMEEYMETAAAVAPLQEKVRELEAALEENQATAAVNQRLNGELSNCTAQLRQKEALCHQLQYEKTQLNATNAALMDESRTKSEDLLKAQMDFQRVISEANKRIEDLAQSLQSTQEELDRTKASALHSAAVLGQKKEKLRAGKTQINEQSAKLAQELLDLQADFETCKGNLQAKEQEIGALKGQLYAKNGEIGERDKALEAADQRIIALTRAIESNQEEADKERIAAGRLMSEISALRVTVEEYSRKAELLSVDKAALKDALESLKAKHEISSRDREEHIHEVLNSLILNQARIKELEEDIALVMQERDTACQHLDTALIQLKDAQETEKTLRDEAEEGKETEKKLREMQNQVAVLQGNKAGLETNNERLMGEIQRLTGESKSQRERLDQLAAELAAAQKDKSLGTLVTQLQREVEEGRQEVEELRQIKQAKELAYSRALEESRGELETCSRDLQTAQNEVKTWKNAVLESEESRKSAESRLGKEILQMQNEVKSLKSTMASEKTALEQALNSLKAAKEAEISSLMEQLNSAKTTISDLHTEKRHLETDMESISLALKDISASLEATEKETNNTKAQNSQLTIELAQCEASKAALELDNSRLSSLVADLRKEIATEMDKNSKEQQTMQKRAISAEELSRELQLQIANITAKNSQLAADLAAAKDAVEKTERNSRKLQEDHEENKKDMEGIVTLLTTAKQHLERNNEELKSHSDHLSEQVATHISHISALTKTLETTEIDKDSLLKQLAETKLAARQDREQLQLRIEHMERDGVTIRETLAECREEITATETLLKAANEAMEQERRSGLELRREKEGLQGQVRSLTGRLEEAFQHLERESREKGDQSNRLRQELRENLQKLADSQLQLEARERDIAQIEAKSAELRANLDQLRSEKAQISANLYAVTTARDSLQQVVDEKESELLEKSTGLQAAGASLQALEANMAIKLDQFRATLQETQGKLAAAQTALEAYKKKAEGLESDLSQLNQSLQSSEKQRLESSAEAKKLKADLTAQENKAAKLSGELMNALQMLGVTRRETAETIDSLQNALKVEKAEKERVMERGESRENELRSSRISREMLEKEIAAIQEDRKGEQLEAANRIKALQSDDLKQSTALAAVQKELESQKAKLQEEFEAWKREKTAIKAENTDLTAAISALEGQLQGKEGERSRLAVEIERSSSRVGELEIALGSRDSDLQRSRKEAENLQSALTSAESKASNLEKELQSALQTIGINRREQSESTEKLQTSLKSLREKNEEMEKNNTKMSAENEHLSRDLRELHREVEGLKADLEAANGRIKEREGEMEQREAVISQLKQAKEGLEGQNQSLKDRLDALFKQLEEESKERTSQGDQSAQLRQDLHKSMQKLADSQLQIEAKTREIAQMQQSANTLERKLEVTIAQEAADKGKLTGKIAEMEKTLSELRIIIELKGKEVENKEEIIAKMRQETVDFRVNISRLSQELSDLQIAQETLISQNSTLANSLKLAEKDLIAEQNRTKLLSQDLNERNNEKKELEKQLTAAELAQEQEKTHSSAVIKQLNSELGAIRTETQELKQQLQASIGSNEDLEQRKAGLEAQIQLQIEGIRGIEMELSAEQEKVKSLLIDQNSLNSDIKQLTLQLQDREKELIHAETKSKQINSELEAMQAQAQQSQQQLIAALHSNEQLEQRKTELEAIVEEQKGLLNAQNKQLERLKDLETALNNSEKATETANLSLIAEQKLVLQLQNSLQTLKSELNTLTEAKIALETQLKAQNESLEQRSTAVSSELEANKSQLKEVNELNHYLEAENVKLEKQLAELAEAKEALEKLNSEQETEISRLIEEVRKANSGDSGDGPILGSLRSENNIANLSGLSPLEEDKVSSADSLDLGAAYNSMPRQDTLEEPLESDPPIRIEEGELSPEHQIFDDLRGLLEAYRNPQDDLVATVRKLLEEFELMKKNPARNVIPRLNLRSQRESKESQTSPRDDLSQPEEFKGSSNADSASVELDKSVGGGSEAADQDTPRQKILPELWMKPVAHKIHQAKGNEATVLRSKVKALEQELQEEKGIAEHLTVQTRLLKEEVAEKERHIKRLEVAESAGEKSPVNIEHLKDVLVKLIIQLPKQTANVETLINTIFSVLFLTPQDIHQIEETRKGIKKKLFGLFK